MPKYWMNHAEMVQYLEFSDVGRLATCDVLGNPYVTPIHYIFMEGCIYFHCARNGKKLDNIMNNCRVCFEVSHVEKMLIHLNACSSATRYTSVLVFGEAGFVNDEEAKVRLLNKMMEKYSGGRSYNPVNPEGANGCTVIQITIENMSGKRNIDE